MKKRLLSLLLSAFCVLAAHSEVQYILNEGFESGIPATWTQQVMSTNSQLWVVENSDLTYPNGAFAGTSRVALRNTTGTTQDYVTRLVTPVLSLPYGSQYQLKFAYASASNGGDVDSLTVFYTTDGTKWQQHTGFGAAQNQWKEVTLDLIGNGAAYQLAFEAFDKQGRGVVLDAVRVFPKSECTDVANFAADPHANSAELSWSGDFGASFQLIVDSAAHELETLNPAAAGLYLYSTTTTSDNELVSGLLSQHKYYAYVRSICDDNESGYTEWQAIEFTTAIGFPYEANFSTSLDGWQNYYGALSGNNLQPNTHATYKWQQATSATFGSHVYGLCHYVYSSSSVYTPTWLVSPAVDITSVAAGSAIELSFNLSISSSSTSKTDLTASNQATTNLYVMVSTDGGNTWSQARVCPGTQFLSTTRRVRVDASEYVGVASSLKFALVAESATTSAYFHVDGIQLHEFDAQCGDVQSVSVVPSDKSAVVNWTVNGKQNVYFQVSTSSSFSTLLVNDSLVGTSYNLTNLTPGTTYYVRVKQQCEDAEWVSVAFMTARGVPYAPTFTTTFPSDWTRLSGTSSMFFADSCTTTTSGWNTSSTYAFSNPHLSCEIYSTTYNYWVVSPSLYLNPASAEHAALNFDMALTFWNSSSPASASSDDRVWLVISEDGGNTWSRANAVLWSANPSDNPDHDYNAIPATGEHVTINLDQYIGKNIKIAFGVETPVGGTDNRIHINNISIRAFDPNCTGLEKLMVNADVNDAVLSWTIGGSTHEALVHVSTKANFSDTVALTAVSGVDTLLVENLEANTKYYARAIQNCSDFVWDDALSLNFKTHCEADTIPYTMGFEDEVNKTDPNCWTIVRTGSDDYPYAYQGQSYAHTGVKSFYYGSTAAQKRSYASLPAFTEAVNTLEMSFWLRAYSASCTNTLEVGVMTNPADTTTFVKIALFQPKSTTYEQQTVSFNSYQGNGKYIAFRNAATGSYGFVIDDIDVHVLPGCYAMGDVTAADITSNGVTLQFYPTNADNYQVVVASNAIDIDSLHLDSIAAKVIYNQVLDGTTGSIVLSEAVGLEANTTYYIYMRGVCSEQELGQWSKVIVFTTLCQAYTAAEFGTEDFSNEQRMACWSNGFTIEGSSTSSAFAARTNVSKFGYVMKLSKEAVNSSSTTYRDGAYAISPEFAVADTINKYQIAFSAATNSTAANNVRKLTISIASSPADLSDMETVQTVVLPYAADSTGLKDFVISFENYEGSSASGEFGHYVVFQSVAGEDSTNYVVLDNIRLEKISNCKQSNETEILNVSDNSALFRWENTGAAQYEVLVDTILTKAVDTIAAPVFRQIVAADSLLITGLSGNAQFYAYVRSVCGEGETGKWSMATAFHTECAAVTEFPWLEDFNAYTTSATLDIECWTNEHIEGTGTKMIRTVNTTKGTNATGKVELEDEQSGNVKRLTLPYMVIPEANAYEFRMDMYRTHYSIIKTGEGFRILCQSASGIDTLAIVPREIQVANQYVDEAPAEGWYTYGFTIPVAGAIHILVDGVSEYGSASCADNFEVRALPKCENPKAIKLDSITETSALVSWTGSSAQYEVIIMNGNALVDSVVIADTVYHFTNLTSGTSYAYTMSLRGICGADSSDVVEKALNINTVCGVKDLPYAEDFESYQTGTFAGACWTNVHVSGNGSSLFSISTSNASSNTNGGKQTLYLPDMSKGTITHLTSPEFNVPADEAVEMSIDIYRNASGSSYVTEGVRLFVLNGNDSTELGFLYRNCTQTDGGVVTAESTTGWYTYVFPIPDSISGVVRILFQGESQYGSATYMDNLKLRAAPTCFPSTNLHVVDSMITETSAAFAWTPYSADNLNAHLIVKEGQKVVVDSIVSDTIFVLNDLTASSRYTFNVELRTICDSTESTDAQTAILNIDTKCTPLTMPWSFDFADATSSEVPVCWEVVRNSGSYPYVSTTSQALYFYGGSSTSEQMIALPELATPLNKLTLTMQYKAASSTSSTYGKLIVGTLDETKDEYSFVALDTLDQVSSKTNYELVLASAPANAKYLAIRYALGSSSNAAYVYNMALDITPSCLPLKSLSAENIDRRSMDIVWTPKAESASYDLVISTEALTDSALNEQTPISVDTTVYHVEGLVRNTVYYIYVRANCGAEDGVSAWTAISQKTAALHECTDVIFSDGADTNTYIPFYGLMADVGFWTQTMYPESMLSDFVGKELNSLKFYITGGDVADWGAAEFQIALGTTTAPEFASATDILLDDQLTLVYEGAVSQQDNVMTINFTQPFLYNGGNLVIDVYETETGNWKTVTFAGTAVSTNSAWYTTDFQTMNLVKFLPKISFLKCVDSDPCPAVETVSHELLGDGTSSARIAWSASTGDYANSYSLVYADSLITDWTAVDPQIDSIQVLDTVISGLAAYTDYYVYVITHCDAEGQHDGSSVWSEAHHFKTASACPVIENLSFNLTGKNAALATWSAPYADKNFVYVLSNELLDDAALDAATPVAVTDTFLAVESLLLDTTYYLYVAHSCGEGGLSPYLMDSIHTIAACPAVANLHTEAITANTVQVAWDRAEFGEETEWEVGIIGRESVAQHVLVQQAFIIGLDADMSYTVYVKAICGVGEESAPTTLAIHTPEMPADEATIGTGTASSTLVNTSWGNTYSQQIYTAAELNAMGFSGGTITSVAFNYTGSSSSYNKVQSIYIGTTSKDQFAGSSASDFETLDLVYGPEDRAYAQGWQTYDLMNPFDWDGQSNIVVGVLTNYDGVSGSSYSTGWSAAGTTESGVYRAVYKTRDNTAIDPDDLSLVTSGSRVTTRPNIIFGFEAKACPAAKALKASDVKTTSAYITWLPGAGEISWAVVLSDSVKTDAQLAAAQPDTLTYKMDTVLTGLTPDTDYYFYVRSLCSSAEADWRHVAFTTLPTCLAPTKLAASAMTDSSAVLTWSNLTPDFIGSYEIAVGPAATFDLAIDTTYATYTTTDTTILVKGLQALSSYKFAVREHCSTEDESRWSAVATFRTECGAYDVPWSEDFEDAVMDCWSLDNGVSVTTTSSYAKSGNHALQFNRKNATVLAVLPKFENLADLQFTYNWRCEGTGNNSTMGYLEAGYVTDDTTFVRLINHPQHIYSYETVELLFPANVPADARPAFRYSGQTDNWYLYVDDLMMNVKPDCSKPVVTVADVAATTITVALGDTADYIVEVALNSTFTDMVDSVLVQQADSFVIDSLLPATTYYIRALRVCGAGEMSEWSTILTQATACVQITTFPWSEDFNGLISGIPACWDNTLGTMTLESNKWGYWAAGKSGACVRMNSYSAPNGQINYLATPELVIDTTLVLSFDWKNPTGGAYEVLASTDNGAHFTTLKNRMTSKTDWTKEEIHLDQFMGQTIRIYFKGTSNYGSGDAYLYLDNVLVSTFNANCQGLDAVTVANVGLSSATVNYHFAGGTHDAVVEISKSSTFGSILVSDTVRNDTTDYVVGLEPSTMYYVRVKQLCGEGEESAFTTASFTTSYGVRYAPVFASTSASTTEWQSTTGTAEDVAANGGKLSTLTGWSLTGASTVLNAIHFKANVYGTSSKKWLVSPAIDLTPNATDGIVLDFDAALTKYNNTTRPAGNMSDDRMVVLVCVDDTVWTKVAEWNNTGTGDYVYSDIDTCATHYQLNLTDFAGQKSVRIAFYGESTQSGDDNDLHVGNIVLDRANAYNYVGDVCDGDDYDGIAEGNPFYIHASEYEIGENRFVKISNDSICILTLTAYAAATYEYSATVCEGETYQDANFDLGTVTLQTNPEQKLKGRYQTVNGCDSTIILHLTINPLLRVNERRQLCAGSQFEWNGQTISTVGNYEFSTSSVVTGCDSTTTLIVTWDQATTVSENIMLCPGDTLTYGDVKITEACDTTFTLSDGVSCDHEYILHVLAPGLNGEYNDTVKVKDLPYVVGNIVVVEKSDEPGQTYSEFVPGSCGDDVKINVYVLDATPVIENHEGEKVEKRMINGRFVIIRNGITYSLQGERLAE